MYSNWRYSTITTQSTTDLGYATIVLTTGQKPRLVFQLSSYNGTNTAAVTPNWSLIPATAGTPDTNGQIQIADNISFPLGNVNADLTSSSELFALVTLPLAAKGAWGGTPITIPPNCMLVVTPHINQNGTVVHKCVSAESDVGVVPLA